MQVSREIVRQNQGEMVTGLVLLMAFVLLSQHSYLLFHSLIELFTVVVATGIFVIAWNARGFLNNNYLVFVGIASLFVAVLDLLHTLAYEGMGVFAGAGGSNLAAQLWIAGRLLQSVSFLVAPLFLGRSLGIRSTLFAFTLTTALLILAIFTWRVFPTMYLEGAGLTATKKVGEYLISLIFLGAIVLLIRKRSDFDPSVVRLLVAALVLFIASEITFTFYLSVYGEANMVGHVLRLMASYALYKAIIETGLERPYALLLRDLKHSQEKLEEYAAALESRNEALIRSEHRLREDATLLEERNVELDAYAHTVAHDLKNPLSVIIAAAEMVREEDTLTPRRRLELLEDVEATARHMDEIVDDLLTLSEVRKVDAPSEPVRMAKVVENVRDRLSVMIRKYDAQLVVPREWPTPLGYAPWVEEVWANFVSNALKYGGRPPRVELGANREAGGRIRFWVKDNGPGVPEDIRSRLFLPFQRLGAAREGGHGLGLSIVQQIMTKLGGQVGVESREGGGSTFYFILKEEERGPTAAADPAPAEPGFDPDHPAPIAT